MGVYNVTKVLFETLSCSESVPGGASSAYPSELQTFLYDYEKQ